jgi:hypothetical protein
VDAIPRRDGARGLVLLLALGALAAGCASRPDTTPLGPMRPNFYRYTGYAEDGSPVVQGWLHFQRERDRRVEGEWWLEQVGPARDIGPQVGMGRIAGERRDTSWLLDLRPERRDDNVFLAGSPVPGGLRGTWEWSGFAGVRAKGTFIALRSD